MAHTDWRWQSWC